MSPSRSHIEQIYREHPLREDTILARLRRDGVPLDAVTQTLLAEDPVTEVTDQNHVGGREFSEAIGRAAEVSARTVVGDLGCGLGGTARVLADTFGCQVEGYEISRQRVRDARALTSLVGLSHLVSFRHADLLRVRVPRERYDVLVGQGALVHIEDKCRLLARWRPALRAGGRLAIEDGCLLRAPATYAERRLLASLEADWAATLVRPGTWSDLGRTAGLDVAGEEDLSSALPGYFAHLLEKTARARPPLALRERRSWRNAIAACEIGLIGLFRLVMRAPGRTSRARR
jgi:cyclopropane fatty-acyl-phospholipid synthase-like methyltransferase